MLAPGRDLQPSTTRQKASPVQEHAPVASALLIPAKVPKRRKTPRHAYDNWAHFLCRRRIAATLDVTTCQGIACFFP